MKAKNYFRLTAALAIAGGTLVACASSEPAILREARSTYQRAATGPAAQSAPTHVQNAKNALRRAEEAFAEYGDSRDTRDLAYIAERLSKLAEAQAELNAAIAARDASKNELSTAEAELERRNQNELLATRDQLNEAQKNLELERQRSELTQAQRDAERDAESARESAEMAQREARSARSEAEMMRQRAEQERLERERFVRELGDAGEVRDESRGTVVVIPGTLLFTSGSAKIRPAARSKLTALANAVSNLPNRRIIIEGHTDSSGSDEKNQALSERRADAVKDFLIAQGVESDRVETVGLGESSPASDNSTPEGRAENRRVEVVIARDEPAA